MTSGSLRLRLIAWGTIAIIAALIVAGTGLSFLFERHVMRSLASDLETDLRQAIGTVELDASDRPFLRRAPSDPQFTEPLSGLYWQVSTEAGGITRSRSLWDVTLQLDHDALVPGETHRHRITGPGNGKLLAVERSVILQSRAGPVAVRVVFAAGTERVQTVRRSFEADLVPALALLGAALAAAMWMQISLGLRPLMRVKEAIKGVREGRAQQLDGPTPNEVEPLVAEINSLLAAQALELERSRGRAADLAHGLKTPLAALAADVRTLEENGETEIAAHIKDVGEAMRRHVERELTRARIRGTPRAGLQPSTHLRPLVETLCAMQKRSEAGSNIDFEIKLPSAAAIAMDKADLAEVLGNLIENAARYARTKVRVSRNADGHIAVEDDGPGIPLALQDAVFERGRRLDERTAGTGLGLAIVQDVLEAYGRKLRFETSQLGGLSATF